MQNLKPLTHLTGKEYFSKSDIEDEFNEIRDRLCVKFKDNRQRLDEMNKVLEQLSEFDLGRFLIKNKGGLSGHWTYYIIVHYRNSTVVNPYEKFILEKSPPVIATRERFYHFIRLLEKSILANMTVCSIPCGLMGEFLHLNLDDKIDNVNFVGIDIDATCFKLAEQLAKERNFTRPLAFLTQDAWKLDAENEFDIVTSNGLNIYESSDEKVQILYRLIYKALKVGGKFIGSHLSLPPGHQEGCEWLLDVIDTNNAQQSKMIFVDILQATWSNFRSAEKTKTQLAAVGFQDVKIIWDTQKIFYTFEATRYD